MGGKQCAPQKRKGIKTQEVGGQPEKPPPSQQSPTVTRGAIAETPKSQRSSCPPPTKRTEPVPGSSRTKEPMEAKPLEKVDNNGASSCA